MFRSLRSSVRGRVFSSRIGSLLLLFQRSPLVQMLFPEARVLGGAGLAEIAKWSIAVVAGLGTYDTVAGATTITQIAPNAGSTTVAATAGSGLSFVFQCTGAPGAPGSWSVTGTLPAGLTHTNAKNNSIDSITGTPTQAGSFPITVKAWEDANFSGGSSSKSFTINVAAVAPQISSHPVSTTINSGGTTTLSVTASGTTPTYQWYRGAAGVTTNPVSGATAKSFTTPALTATAAYWVRATNTAGSANSNAATVTVRIPPAFTTQPAPVTIHSGETATFTVAASGTAPTFQWYQGTSGVTTSPISGATGLSFTTPPLAATASYWVRATNAVTSVDSATATATILSPLAITANPLSTTIDSGGTATLTVATSGNAPTFQWYQGTSGDISQPVAEATSGTFTTPVLTATASYWVRATSGAEVVDSGTATITVTPPLTTWQYSQFSPAALADALISGPDADPDSDGMTNRQEYIFGQVPLSPESSPLSAPTLASGQISLNFTAKKATGQGYAGLTRHYALEAAGAPDSPSWAALTGYDDIVGNDQPVSCTAPATGPRQFYRLSVWLTP